MGSEGPAVDRCAPDSVSGAVLKLSSSELLSDPWPAVSLCSSFLRVAGKASEMVQHQPKYVVVQDFQGHEVTQHPVLLSLGHLSSGWQSDRDISRKQLLVNLILDRIVSFPGFGF